MRLSQTAAPSKNPTAGKKSLNVWWSFPRTHLTIPPFIADFLFPLGAVKTQNQAHHLPREVLPRSGHLQLVIDNLAGAWGQDPMGQDREIKVTKSSKNMMLMMVQPRLESIKSVSSRRAKNISCHSSLSDSLIIDLRLKYLLDLVESLRSQQKPWIRELSTSEPSAQVCASGMTEASFVWKSVSIFYMSD